MNPRTLIRPAQPRDYEAFERLFPELGVKDPTPTHEYWNAQMVPFSWVAVDPRSGDVHGYCYCQRYDEDAYVRNIVVDAKCRGNGVGTALMTTASRELYAAGYRTLRLNVRSDNAAAISLYQSVGLEAHYETTPIRFLWSDLPRLPRSDVIARRLDPSRDSVAETLFGVPKGQLRSVRNQGRLLVEAVDATSELRGFAAHNPSFPECFPFRTLDEGVAGAMLDYLQTLVQPREEHLFLVCEDNPVLTETLIRCGGTVIEHILHMAGPIRRAA